MKSINKVYGSVFCAALLLAGQAYAACSPPSNIEVTKPDNRYTDNGDGSVTDNTTDLIWAKCSLGQNNDATCSGTANTYTWQEALAAARTANSNGYLGQDDWRLPNVRELRSLADKACANPAINATLFPATVFPITVSNTYWTSSPSANTSTLAWFVNFSDGYEYTSIKGNLNRVRLVRGGQ